MAADLRPPELLDGHDAEAAAVPLLGLQGDHAVPQVVQLVLHPRFEDVQDVRARRLDEVPLDRVDEL